MENYELQPSSAPLETFYKNLLSSKRHLQESLKDKKSTELVDVLEVFGWKEGLTGVRERFG